EMPGYALFFEAAGRNAAAFGFDPELHLSAPELEKAERLLEEMQREEEQKESGYPFAMTALFIQLLLLLSRICGRNMEVPDGGLLISRLLRKELPPDCSVEELARENGMSVRTLERLFRKNLGCTPLAYLTELRLTRSAELLNTTELPIVQVAGRAGFSDTGYFIRFFRKKYGLSPREFRRQCRT
ncbi:MAG: helix-turn-helix domain-containing protein, partial [Victivallis vadensis]